LLPVRLYLPRAGTGPFPLILFSPGVGNSREHYSALGRYWAAQGYAAAFITHPDTDETVIYGQHHTLSTVVVAVLDAVRQVALRWEHPLDVRFVLDQLLGDPTWRGLLDAERIGVAGHSFGAITALALVGLYIDGAPELADPRFKAVVALSPPAPGGLGLSNDASQDIDTPTLTVIGTLDIDPVTPDPQERRAFYDNAGGRDEFLLTLVNATHGVFDNRSQWLIDQIAYPQYRHEVEEATQAFFDAYLQRSAAAQTALVDRSAGIDFGEDAVLEFKNVTPLD
jgi:predicted dienelactone hydrolase